MSCGSDDCLVMNVEAGDLLCENEGVDETSLNWFALTLKTPPVSPQRKRPGLTLPSEPRSKVSRSGDEEMYVYRDYYMTLDRFSAYRDLANVYFFDVQFIDNNVSEVSMLGPGMTSIFHRVYALPARTSNPKTFRHNILYTGRRIYGVSSANLFNDDALYASIPQGAVIIIRGRDKLRYLRSQISDNKLVKYFTFPTKFVAGTDVCPIHTKAGICAVANVINMSKYYKMYTELCK